MHDFIRHILIDDYSDKANSVFENNKLIQYLDSKMNAINGNAKSRRSFASIYAIYSILHFYVKDYYEKPDDYKSFDGYEFTKLFTFCRTMYGGEKIQNHALNNRVNFEFHNKFSNEPEPIISNNGKYLLHPNYIYTNGNDVSKTIIKIVEKYVELLIKKDSTLIKDIEELCGMDDTDKKKQKISDMINENSEARIFEIVSYAVLKNYYKGTSIYIGNTREEIKEEQLRLYKTGRTNANDGGIDFVMRPLGRFFQVTEVSNYDKYTLDMDKVLHFPITFVIKTEKTKDTVLEELEEYIKTKSGGLKVVEDRYHQSIEEIITINELRKWLYTLSDNDINSLLKDIELYYKIELNFGLSENYIIDKTTAGE